MFVLDAVVCVEDSDVEPLAEVKPDETCERVEAVLVAVVCNGDVVTELTAALDDAVIDALALTTVLVTE